MSVQHPLREGLPELPSRMQKLERDARGYPIPWFVAEVSPGVRDFRVMDGEKRDRAVVQRLCWVCGERLGKYLTFCLGPMCAINRTISEPPSHWDCAHFSAQACPFLTLPKAKRREANLPEGKWSPTGIKRNPGVVLLWTCLDYEPFRSPSAQHAGGELLFHVGDPHKLEWYCEGRTATRIEILESIYSGLPILEDMARKQGKGALEALDKAIIAGLQLVPA